jgi:hypothetical protein
MQYMKGNIIMGKVTKAVNKNRVPGTPASGLSPEQRRKENIANNNQKYHLNGGAAFDGSTEPSEFTGQAPHERAKSRGVPNPPRKRVAFDGRY